MQLNLKSIKTSKRIRGIQSNHRCLTYFCVEFVLRGGGMGARVLGFERGKEICFLARGGAGGRRSEDDDIFERVSSLELLLLLLNK